MDGHRKVLRYRSGPRLSRGELKRLEAKGKPYSQISSLILRPPSNHHFLTLDDNRVELQSTSNATTAIDMVSIYLQIPTIVLGSSDLSAIGDGNGLSCERKLVAL